MYLTIFGINLAHTFSAPGLAWQVDIGMLTDTDMLLMIEKVSQVEYVMLFINMQKLIQRHERL